jgi:hypothetical protein
VREVVAAALPPEFRSRINEGDLPKDMKAQALPQLVLIDLAATYERTTEDRTEVHTVQLEALDRTRAGAEALLARAGLPLDSQAPLSVAGYGQTYTLRTAAQAEAPGRYDMLAGEDWHAARAAWRVRVRWPF